MVRQINITLPNYPRGFHLVTQQLIDQLGDLPNAGILHIIILHTSAGLTINENADPTVRVDFETILNQLVPEGSQQYIHTTEGLDDMPAHVKSSLVGHSVTIPISSGRLNLGIWQGVYLCEFRNAGGRRKLVATIIY